ncbi:pyruvate kinase 2, cytosolic-like [Cucumis melo var. makuwa]|uniref:Pyruvate kinase n=1 Tax=Cucumis melo var. makuwa TaxID=1194695 RepID=A0A5A7UIR4_CUCMM|nr:pyruvate kinase 2, cytosolic-like [Cucumis melo var. makuwa]
MPNAVYDIVPSHILMKEGHIQMCRVVLVLFVGDDDGEHVNSLRSLTRSFLAVRPTIILSLQAKVSLPRRVEGKVLVVPKELLINKDRGLGGKGKMEDGFVVLTPNQELEASSELLPINYGGFSKVLKKGDTLFLGQYLFTGSETSVWLEVFEVKGDDVGCVVKNSATLAQQFLSKLGDLNQTQIFAKIESVEVFLFQKTALYRCNMAGKPAVLTRVVNSMTNNLRPTRAVATDVANAVLDGDDAIILGAETLHGLHPVETVSTVSRICVEAQLSFGENEHLT